jgi:hypothetical protein
MTSILSAQAITVIITIIMHADAPLRLCSTPLSYA